MPSVITTHQRRSRRRSPRSTASLANAGGTKTTDTSAPVSFIASRDRAEHRQIRRRSRPCCRPCAAFTPPTMFVPAASIRRVCLVPSEPVMPWTMTLLSSVSKIAIGHAPAAASSAASSAAPSIVSTCSTSGWRASSRIRRPSSALLPSSRTTSGLRRPPRRGSRAARTPHDAVGHRVARGDAAEDVDEHARDGRVGEDDLQPVGHHLGRRAAADVEEVGRAAPRRAARPA